MGRSRSRMMAMSVPPVSAAKCWIRERVAGGRFGVVEEAVRKSRRRVRLCGVRDGRGMERS